MFMKVRYAAALVLAVFTWGLGGDAWGRGVVQAADAAKELARYRDELEAFRKEFGGTGDLPDGSFFLFGMGKRSKLIYKDGALTEWPGGKTLRAWKVKTATIVPPAYSVFLTTSDGGKVVICEDEEAVWIEENGKREEAPGSRGAVKLPAFEGRRYARILRVLHQELLVNVVDGNPVPNFLVYGKPWYRDGAMMAMCFKMTGNLDLIREWILGLSEPYDRNNNGETEADNLGEALYLISLVSDKSHPLIKKILAELPKYEKAGPGGKYIEGRSDFAAHPVYQTKWAKFGLRALGLPDPYVIPKAQDSYSALFWMDYKETYVKGGDSGHPSYPYLNWAVDHFHGLKRSPIGNRDYPLTWEKNASQARYEGMKAVGAEYARQRLSVPHTWHAAEVFLYLLNGQD